MQKIGKKQYETVNSNHAWERNIWFRKQQLNISILIVLLMCKIISIIIMKFFAVH